MGKSARLRRNSATKLSLKEFHASLVHGKLTTGIIPHVPINFSVLDEVKSDNEDVFDKDLRCKDEESPALAKVAARLERLKASCPNGITMEEQRKELQAIEDEFEDICSKGNNKSDCSVKDNTSICAGPILKENALLTARRKEGSAAFALSNSDSTRSANPKYFMKNKAEGTANSNNPCALAGCIAEKMGEKTEAVIHPQIESSAISNHPSYFSDQISANAGEATVGRTSADHQMNIPLSSPRIKSNASGREEREDECASWIGQTVASHENCLSRNFTAQQGKIALNPRGCGPTKINAPGSQPARETHFSNVYATPNTFPREPVQSAAAIVDSPPVNLCAVHHDKSEMGAKLKHNPSKSPIGPSVGSGSSKMITKFSRVEAEPSAKAENTEDKPSNLNAKPVSSSKDNGPSNSRTRVTNLEPRPGQTSAFIAPKTATRLK